MPPFPKPSFTYNYQLDAQIQALRDWEKTEPGRNIPDKAQDRVLLATWNIANLGVQDRRDQDYELIAEILGWFDVIAIQETHSDLTGLMSIKRYMSADYRLLFSDAGGNDERMTFLFDGQKMDLLDEIGEVAPPPSDYRNIKLPGIEQKFDGFDRTPYLATFHSGGFIFSLVNVHLYFGSDSTVSKNRRSLETFAVARWADNRRKSKYAFTHDIVPLGDFNLPKVQQGDPIFDALTARGMILPQHSTQAGSAIASDSHYDQVVFFPGETMNEFVEAGVFDFDGAVFRTLWDTRGEKDFLAYVRYYLSDHRPLWAQFKTGP
jgi:endonuclease/exonuclease/phosphatase family metal-dependent hydrolase